MPVAAERVSFGASCKGAHPKLVLRFLIRCSQESRCPRCCDPTVPFRRQTWAPTRPVTCQLFEAKDVLQSEAELSWLSFHHFENTLLYSSLLCKSMQRPLSSFDAFLGLAPNSAVFVVKALRVRRRQKLPTRVRVSSSPQVSKATERRALPREWTFSRRRCSATVRAKGEPMTRFRLH